jgi:hypothetical protein
MLTIIQSKHAAIRMNQRGFRGNDISVLLEFAEQLGGDRYRLTQSATHEAIAEQKRKISALERLCGSELVIADGHLVTLFHTGKGKAGKPKKQNGDNYEH